MTSKTLLATLKAVTGELKFAQPISVLSSNVATDVQLRQLAVAVGDELLDAYDWQALIRQNSFVATSDTVYDLPPDCHRILSGTMSAGKAPVPNVTITRWGGLGASELRYRILGDKIEVVGATPGTEVGFYYVSSYYVLDGGNGLPKAEFSLDSDKTVYHPRLFTNFIKLKFLQTQGLDARAAAEDFNSVLMTAMSGDAPAPVLDIGGNRPPQDWTED